VNVTVLLVPPGVVTLTVLAPSVALAVMVKVVVTVVEVEVKAPAVTPLPPDTVTAVAPVRFVPVKVTGTSVPRAPDVESDRGQRRRPCSNTTGEFNRASVNSAISLP